MNGCRKWVGLTVAVLGAAVAGSHAVPARVSVDPSHGETAWQLRLPFSHALPQMDGGHLRVSVEEVAYGPGESSPPHSHPCPVIGYVAKGAIRTQVKGEPEAIYKAGEIFYEAPNGVHLVSANASNQEPATLIAYFVCDHDTPLSVDAPGHGAPGGKQP